MCINGNERRDAMPLDVSRANLYAPLWICMYMPHFDIIRRHMFDRRPCWNWTSWSDGNTWMYFMYRIVHLYLPLL